MCVSWFQLTLFLLNLIFAMFAESNDWEGRLYFNVIDHIFVLLLNFSADIEHKGQLKYLQSNEEETRKHNGECDGPQSDPIDDTTCDADDSDDKNLLEQVKLSLIHKSSHNAVLQCERFKDNFDGVNVFIN
jgi:hypothetical protein